MSGKSEVRNGTVGTNGPPRRRYFETSDIRPRSAASLGISVQAFLGQEVADVDDLEEQAQRRDKWQAVTT